MTPQAFSLGGEGGPAGPDEGRTGRSSPINGRQRQSCPSSVRLAVGFPLGGSLFLSLGKPMKKPEELLEWGGTKKDSTLPAFSRHMMQVSKINLTISMTLNRYSRA